MLEFRVKFGLEHWQLEHLEICLLGEKRVIWLRGYKLHLIGGFIDGL